MESTDPFRSSVADEHHAENIAPLGSLSQAARVQELKQEQRILVIVGIAILGLSGIMFRALPSQVEKAIEAKPIAPDQVAAFRRAETMSSALKYGGAALFGAVFLVSGLLVTRFPVPVVLTCLGVSIAVMILNAVLNPGVRRGGFFVYLVILAFLYRLWEVARGLERHKKQATAGEVPA